MSVMTEKEATVMYLNAVGILNHQLIPDWTEHTEALLVRAKDNPKLDMTLVYVFERNGRLVSIENPYRHESLRTEM
jgi:hypothetical protein